MLLMLTFTGWGPNLKNERISTFIYPFSTLHTHALVPVVLSDVDREGDVIEDDIAPGDVPRESVSTGPALEASTVKLVLHHDILEENVLDRCDRTTLAERTDGESMTTLTVVLNEPGKI